MLIDFDNVTMGIRSNLGQELRNLLDSDVIRGKVSVQRAYADWRRYPQYIVPLSEASIDLIFAPAYGSSKKNATDIRLAIDALEIVFTRPEIGTFILLSGDSDFSSLVLKLKEYGKYIIGVGMQESSSDLLVQNCDEYYSYNSLSGLTAASEATTESFDPWVLAAKTIRRMVDRGDVMRSDRFKQVMLEFDPSFSEKSLGFSKFNRFLAEAASRGIVDLEKAANGQYDVSPGSHTDEFSKGGHPVSSGSGSSGRSSSRSSSSRSRSRSDSGSGGRSGGGSRSRSSSRRDGGSRRSSGDRGRREAPPSDQPTPEVDVDRLRTAYTLLQDVVEDLARVGQPVRDSEIKRQMLKRDSKFDEGALGFRKFSRFLRQAHDEEVINLEQGPEGNYLVSPQNGAASGGRSGSDAEGRRPEKAEVDEGKDSSSEPSREPETKPEPQADTRAESKGESETEAETEAEAEPERRSRGRGLGRFRRGSKGRSSAPTAATSEDRTVPGPVDAPPADDGAEDEKDVAVPEKPAAKEVHVSRSVTGRGSSRESTGPRADASAPGNGAGSGSGAANRADRGGAQVSEKYKEEIDAMSRAYPGVGRRTAERLYEEFGDRLLDVIDNQPQRISDVLPEHRAKAVIEGREAQLDENA